MSVLKRLFQIAEISSGRQFNKGEPKLDNDLGSDAPKLLQEETEQFPEKDTTPEPSANELKAW